MQGLSEPVNFCLCNINEDLLQILRIMTSNWR